MPKAGSAQFALLTLDGVNLLTAKVHDMNWKTHVGQQDTTGLSDHWGEHTPYGMRRATVNQVGAYFDTQLNGLHETMHGMPLPARTLIWSPDGVTLYRVVGTLVTEYTVLAKLAGLTKADVKYVVSGALQEGGTLVQPPTDQTVSWAGPVIDSGAASGAGATAVQGVTVLDAGVTGFVGVLRHSPDGAAWTDLATFANVTAVPNAQTVTVAGVVQRYLYFAGTIAGSGTVRVSAGLFRT